MAIVASMSAAISFHVSDLPPDQLQVLLAEHLKIQQLQIFRRLVVTRLLVVAVVATGAGRLAGVLSPVASVIVAGIFTIPAAAVWMAEVAAKRRFRRRLAPAPHAATVLGSHG